MTRTCVLDVSSSPVVVRRWWAVLMSSFNARCPGTATTALDVAAAVANAATVDGRR